MSTRSISATVPEGSQGAAGDPNMPAILVPSCDPYADLWEPFFATFFKYWPDCPYQAYLGANTLPFEHPRVRRIFVGCDLSYSDNLRAMLLCIPHDYVILWVDDRLVSGPVKTRQVGELVGNAVKNNVRYLKLIPEHPLGYGAGPAPIAEIPPHSPYRISLTVALWHKDTLLSLLKPNESAWMLEKRGSRRSDHFLTGFFGLAPSWKSHPPIPHVHVVVKGKIIRASLSFLRRERIIKLLDHREIETWKSVLYSRAYHLFFGAIRPVQAHLLRASSRLAEILPRAPAKRNASDQPLTPHTTKAP